jgi:phage-related protein
MPDDVVKKVELTAAVSPDYQAAFKAAASIAKDTSAQLQALTKREADLQRLAALQARQASTAGEGNAKQAKKLESEYTKLAERLGMVGKSAAEISAELSKMGAKKGSLQELYTAASKRAQIGKVAGDVARLTAAYQKTKDPILLKHLENQKKKFKELGGTIPKATGAMGSLLSKAAEAPGILGALSGSLKSVAGALAGPLGVVALLAGAGAAAAGAAKAFYNLAIDAAKSGDKIIKTADALGVSTDAFQELSYAMQRGGATEEQFSTALRQIDRQLESASAGNRAAIDSFKRLGISVQDVKSMNAEEAFYAIADGIHAIDDPAKRMKTSMELLGRSGEQVAYAMSVGSDGLRELRKSARDTGFVRTRKQLEDAAKASDSLLDAQLSLKAALNEVGQAAMPAVIDILKDFAQFMRDNKDAVRDFASGVATFMKLVAGAVGGTFTAIKTTVNSFRLGFEFWQGKFAKGFGAVAEIAGKIIPIFRDAIPGAVSTAVSFIKNTFEGVVEYIRGLISGIIDYILSVPDRLRELAASVPLIGELFEKTPEASQVSAGKGGGSGVVINVNTSVDARGADSSAGIRAERAVAQAGNVSAEAVGKVLNRYGELGMVSGGAR